jgi:hypothetical protein
VNEKSLFLKRAHSKGELDPSSRACSERDRSPALIVVDAVLHGLVDKNPSEAAIKFIDTAFLIAKKLSKSN